MNAKRIMIVDDDADIVDVISSILTFGKYLTVSVTNAANLIEHVNVLQPALILLDIQLGGYDGRFLCKQIKQTPHLAHIKVILISANPSHANTVKSYLCDDFIPKPFDMHYLLNKINKVLNGAVKVSGS